MSQQTMVHECEQELRELLPMLGRPLHKALASLVSGAVLAESVRLSRASAASPGLAKDRSKQRRAQRLVANARFDVAACRPALIRRILEHRVGRLDLLLDATTTGASAHDPGTVTLLLALGEQGRALPLTWQTWTADTPDQDWASTIPKLFAHVEAERAADTQVVLMADRGLGNAALAQQALAMGWHYLLRVTRTTRVWLPDGQVHELGDLVPEPGTCRLVTGARVGAPRHKVGATWVSAWAQALVTNVVAVWRTGDPEPWLLLTDLPAERRRCSEYRRRTWEEELLRDCKRLGLEWDLSRVRIPERVERLLVVLTLAQLWLIGLGQRVIRRGWRHQVDDRSRRTLSRFQLGLRWLKRQLLVGQRAPCSLHCWTLTYAPVKLS
jgi:hypothetical protein